MRCAAVIMAAGKSTRMKSALPKAAHMICGKPMTAHVIDACKKAGAEDIVVIVGHEAEKVKAALGSNIAYAYQHEQLGTGHAAKQALPYVADEVDTIIVLPADTPLITSNTIQKLINKHVEEKNAATLLTAVLPDAAAYGRALRDQTGAVIKIVEAKDADVDILKIKEINTSIYCFDKDLLAKNLELIKPNNAQAEYYLTDVIELLNSEHKRVGAVIADNASDAMGINNRAELAEATSIMRKRINEHHMLSGVTLIDPKTTYIDCDVEIGQDTVIWPCTIISYGTKIEANEVIGPFACLDKGNNR